MRQFFRKERRLVMAALFLLLFSIPVQAATPETAAPAADDGTAGLTAEEPMVFAQTETDSAEVPADSDTAEHTEPQA